MDHILRNINAIKLYHNNVAAQFVSTSVKLMRVKYKNTSTIRDFCIIWEIMLITRLNVQCCGKTSGTEDECKVHPVDVTSFGHLSFQTVKNFNTK